MAWCANSRYRLIGAKIAKTELFYFSFILTVRTAKTAKFPDRHCLAKNVEASDCSYVTRFIIELLISLSFYSIPSFCLGRKPIDFTESAESAGEHS